MRRRDEIAGTAGFHLEWEWEPVGLQRFLVHRALAYTTPFGLHLASCEAG